jgi:hypothetical protein
MIVRVLDEAQYELPDSSLPSLEKFDVALNAAIESSDQGRFDQTLQAALETVRGEGRKLDAGKIVPSDLTLPHEGFSLGEVRQLLDSEDVTEEATRSITGGA